MENWEIIKVQCIDTLDPKVVRVSIKLTDQLFYDVDIPAPLYPDIGAALGWPTSPCAD